MIREDFRFLSKDTKTKIHGVRWMPDDGAVHGVIQLVHGMQEYIGRYEELAEFLTHAETLGYNDSSVSGKLEMIEWLQSEVEESDER